MREKDVDREVKDLTELFVKRSHRRMLKLFISSIFLLSLFSHQVIAAGPNGREVRFKELPLDVRDGDRLIVIGWKGQLKIDGKAKSNSIRAAKSTPDKQNPLFDALTFSTRRDDQSFIIEWKGPAKKEDLELWLKGPPDLSLELNVASRLSSVEIQWRDGSIQLSGIRVPVNVWGNDLSARAGDLDQRLAINAKKLEAKLDDIKGGLDVNFQTGHLFASKLDGDTHLTTFSGDITVTESAGSLSVRSNDGPVRLSKTVGSLEVDSMRAQISTNSHQGPVRGRIEEGSLSLDLSEEADVQLQSGKGTVSVKAPSGSNAYVKVVTENGSVGLPDSVRLQPGGSGQRTYAGRLAGSGSKGTIQVSAKEGFVRVR